MIGQMERFLKQALVDKNPFIMASTLCAGQHLFQAAPDVIKRWLAEIQEALNSKARMVQYHALALLYRVKQHDKLAINKVVTSLARSNQLGHAPMAQCLHIRLAANLLQTTAGPLNPELLKYLFDCLHNKHFMVMYESAKAIVRLDQITAVQCVPAVNVLQEMLSSQVPVQRFSAVRTLSEVVVRFPLIVAPCVVDLEHLITDPNRNIATLAITTLLKTGVESNVDRLMKSISGFMTDISDEFKIVLVDAIRALCLKFPHKYPTLLNFLASSLREDGGYKFKKAIVDSMLLILADVPEATEVALEHLCEFIEDSEFPELSVKILHVLGDRGPQTAQPNKYIRFIFNRVILETASVRCAAVSSLAKFGTRVPHLTNHIVILLKRCLMDNDDEVRDRAIFYSNLLSSDQQPIKAIIEDTPLPSFSNLEHSLSLYLDSADKEQPFSIAAHLQQAPIDEQEQAAAEQKQKADAEGGLNMNEEKDAKTKAAHAQAALPPAATQASVYVELFNSIPELKELGPIFKSAAPVELTETETEYVVTCIKHITQNHVVFQFQLTNTLEEHQLEEVRVDMEPEDPSWQEELSIPEPVLKVNTPGVTFVVFSRPPNSYVSGSFNCTLHFFVREVSPDDPEPGPRHEDEYQLEDVDVVEHDFMKSGEENVGLVQFRSAWEGLGDGQEVVKKYSLGLDSLQAAVNAVTDLLGMQASEQSGVVPEGARSRAVNLTGVFFGGIQVYARAGFMMDAKHGVTLKIAVRSANPQVNQMLTNAIR